MKIETDIEPSVLRAIIAITFVLLVGLMPSAALSCNPGPYIVFFERKSAEIDRENAELLHSVVSIHAVCGGGQARMTLSGHSDTSERAIEGRKRANVVRAYLIRRGIDPRKIKVTYFGSTKLRVPTPLQTAEIQNRRVEIHFGPDD